jgi:hypothetical protein
MVLKLDTSESRSEIPGEFGNVVLDDGEQLDRSREKRRSIQGGEEYPTHNKKKEGYWTGHIVHRNCLLKQDTEGKIEGRLEATGR